MGLNIYLNKFNDLLGQISSVTNTPIEKEKKFNRGRNRINRNEGSKQTNNIQSMVYGMGSLRLNMLFKLYELTTR